MGGRRCPSHAHRAGHVHHDRGALRGRDPGSDTRGRATRPGPRGHDPAWRRLQAPDLALRVPGPRRQWPEDPGGCPSRDRASGRHRDRGRRRHRCGGRVRGHAAGGHAQHGELRPPAGAGVRRQARDAQTRHERHDRGVAHGGRVHRPARQSGDRPVRTGYPHVRDRHSQHTRRVGGARRPGPVASADHHRPEPLRWSSRPGGAAVTRQCRRRCRWRDHRCPSRSTYRPV